MSTPIMAAIAAGTLVLATPIVLAAQSVTAGAQARQTADAAALAAADAMLGFVDAWGSTPCELAEEVARTNGGVLGSCAIEENRGEARVSVTVQIGLYSVTEVARAGPAGPATE